MTHLYVVGVSDTISHHQIFQANFKCAGDTAERIAGLHSVDSRLERRRSG